MAIARTTIEIIRVTASDGSTAEFPWSPDTWYLVRDDRPFLDILVRGFPIQAAQTDTLDRSDPDEEESTTSKERALVPLEEAAAEGMQWQRWNLEADLARRRRLGELTLPLKVPKGLTLRCYVIPARLLDLSDVLAMVGHIEEEVGIHPAWDMVAKRPERAWSRTRAGRASTAIELVHLVEEELIVARLIRRRPFQEIGLATRRATPLPENAIVSHWASRRHQHLTVASELMAADVAHSRGQLSHLKAPARRANLITELDRLKKLEERLSELRVQVASLVSQSELTTLLSPAPSFQRDHKLRRLLRAFAPPPAESLSPVEATRSQYPPVLLNGLWELWGAIWLAMQLRRMGFVGAASTRGDDALRSCSWSFQRDSVRIDLDYEPDPVLLDHANLPPAHARAVPALEWGAEHQTLDEEKPLLGTELRCSPDYTLRISTPTDRILIVGDACLASPEHHGKGRTKPETVEHYRRTIGWVVNGRVVRCHPMGSFVIFPPPASAWAAFEATQGVRDCTLLCPSPTGREVETERLANLLRAVLPGWKYEQPLAS
jgi:hypothetical protein